MTRSVVILRCLLNSGCSLTEEDIKERIKLVFAEAYPREKYSKWDMEINDETGKQIIKTVGRASQIRVDLFIRDLWDIH